MRRSIVKRWALLLLGVAASLGVWAQAGQAGDAFITLWDLSLQGSEVWTGKGALVQGVWAEYEKLPASDGTTLYFPGRGSQSCIVEFLRADKNPQTDKWTPVPIAPDQFTSMKPLKIQFPEAGQRWYVRVFPKDADGKDAFWEFRMGHWRKEWEGNWRLFGDASRLVRVVSWGRVNWVGLEAAFFGCSNLEQLPLVDDPKFPDRVLLPGKVTGIIDYLFSGCKKLKTTNSANKVEWTLGDWDVSDATRMRGIFKECELYNDNLARWNVGKVTDFYEAFKLAKKFDCDISRWDMRQAVCVSWMFSGTEAFNVDLALWKFENLEEMTEMVSHSRAFNRPLGRWNLSKVKKAASFARDARALKTRNIDHLLLGWGAQATTPGEGFSRFIWISPNSHSARSQEGYNSLTGKGWKIMGETTENPYEYHKLEGIRLATHDIYAQKGQQTSLEAILDVARIPSNATYGEIYAIQAGDDTDKAFVTPAGSIWAYEVGEVQLTITTLEGDFRENVTLHVVDEANCTVRLHPRNGDDERTLYIPKGSVLARPEDPTKAGKRFAGWYTDAGFTTPYDFTQSVTQDLDLYAKWADGAVVTFDAKGGAPTPNELVVNWGDKIDPSKIDPLPKKEGYTLAGWCSDEDCENPWDFSANEVNGNITLYAKWIKAYTVTFHPNNGETDFTEIVEEGKFAKGPNPSPTREGFALGGWYTDNDAWTDKWDLATHPVTADVELYAKWVTLHTVTFHLNNGEPDYKELVPDSEHAHGPTPAPTKEHHTLQGWFTNDDHLWELENDIVGQDMELWAKWDPATYTITFNANGGAPTPPSQSKHYGEKVSAPTGVTKAGYTLEGWYTDEQLTPAKKWDFDNSTVTEDITLYAKWVTVHTVTFHLNNGEPDFIETVEHGKTAKGPQNLTKDCSNFAYWNTSDGHEWTLDSDPVTQDMELSAIWVPKSVTVTFDSKGGTPVPAQSKHCGEKVTEPTGVTKEGYTLAGWYSDEACTDGKEWNFNTPLSGDITLYAKWLPDLTITYTITFNANGGTPTPAPQSKHYGEKVKEPTGVTLAGSKLAGWYLEPTYDHRWNFDNNIVTGEMTLYAKWLPEDEPTFTVTFHPNNGQGDILKHVPQNMPAGDPYPVPTKEGHNVAGWFTTEDLNVEWNIYSTPVTHDMELWAKWVPGHYTVTFHPNIPGNPLFTEDVSYGNFVEKPLPLKCPGYTLVGWYTDGGTWTDKWDFDHSPVLGDLHLYAYWVTAHTVTLHPNNDTEDIRLSVAHGALVQIPAGITKDCHDLKGWYTDAGLTHEWNTGTQQVSQDMELWAKWELKPITVTFDSKGGTAVPPQSKVCGDKVDAPSGVTKDGYALEGWYTDEQLTPTKKWDFDNNTLTEDITLYAKWIALHTVTFHPNNGESDFTETVEDGKFANGPTPTFSKTGFTFDAWYTDDGAWNDKWDLATRPVTADVDLYAKWKPVTYTITFNANGGSPTPAPQSKHYGEKADAPTGVTQAGYTLEGWYTDEQLTPASKWDFDNSTVEGNITLYAKWVAAHTVTFHLDNGQPDYIETVEHGKFANGPTPAPTKTGFTFVGWYTDNGTWGDKWELATRPVTADVDLYAKWDPATYTITFNANGGSPTPPSQSKHYGEKVDAPPVVTKAGFTLEGWYTDEQLTPASKWDFDNSTVEGNITLYAKWAAAHTVTFHLDNGQPDYIETVEHGKTAKGPQDLAKDCSNFAYWNTSDGHEWALDSNPVTQDMDLYAIWVLKAVTVTFDSKGGTAVPPQSKVCGEKVAAPTGVTKAGYTLEGWYTDEQLTPTNKWNFDNSTVTEDITLYAKWTEDSYTVTFDAKGGSPTPPSQSKHYGDRVEEPSGVTRDGYTLEGWYTDEQLTPTKKWDFVNNPVTESITLYAKWIVLHTVTFHPNNGESDFTETVEEGKFANGPTSEPIREGFTFGGWYTDNDHWTDKWDLAAHPVTANVDLYAKWKPKTYDFVVIVLDENGNPIEGATVIIKDKPSLTASDGKAHYKLTEGADYSCSVSKKGYIQGSGTFKIPLEGEITITLKSAPPSYTVTIDLQDGSSPTKHGVAPEEKFPQPSTPLRSGYLFVVWTTDREGTHPYNFETPVTGDLTLYAQWKKDSQIDAVEALTEVTMAPNPFSSTLRLEHAERILHLVVYTATGHRLVELAHSGAPSIVLNTSHWVGGLYLIRVTGAEGSRVLTAVKR